jgi:uncharacterized phage infection (PIP) family protein YhgE
MRHQVIIGEGAAIGIIPAAIATLDEIVGSLDARFLPVSATLVALVETIETVVSGLTEIQSAFASSNGGQAIDAMLEAADKLVAAPSVQSRRRTCFEDSRETVASLTSCSADLDRVIAMLQFYIMNIKIVAAGSSDFVDFADEMRSQLDNGRREVTQFNAAITSLLSDINGLLIADGNVAKECFKIIPDVPDRLRSAAGSLRDQQDKLADIAQTTGAIASRIQQRIVAALSAIQIGDIARQRIEHVVLACTIANDLSNGKEGADDCAGMPDDKATRFARAHILKLSVAQLEAIRADFSHEAGQLLESLELLVPDSRRLLEFSKNNTTISESGQFISKIEEAIGQTRSLTDQLRNADEDASCILRSVMATVESIATRVRHVQLVGLKVGNMSVNAHLRCRRNEALSKPVAVIAREIKVQADLIKDRTVAIGGFSEQLKALAIEISGLKGAGLDTVADALNSSLTALRSAAERTESGVGQVNVNASAVTRTIEQTAADLRESLGLVSAIDTVIGDLTLASEPLGPDGEITAEHPLWAIMEQLKASYTMASERAVHNRFLLGGLPGCAIDDSASDGDLSDDDLFDDALF